MPRVLVLLTGMHSRKIQYVGEIVAAGCHCKIEHVTVDIDMNV